MKSTLFTLMLCFCALIPAFAQSGQPMGGANRNVSIEDSIRLQYDYSLNGKDYDFTFLEFGSHYCVPCKRMESVMDSVRVSYPHVNIRFIDATSPKAERWIDYFNIDIIPQQVILDKEGKVVFHHIGYIPYKELIKQFNKTDNEKD